MQDVGSKRTIGIHCCTFSMPVAEERFDEPPVTLIEEAQKAGLRGNEFVTLQHGGMIVTSGGIDRGTPPLLPRKSQTLNPKPT